MRDSRWVPLRICGDDQRSRRQTNQVNGVPELEANEQLVELIDMRIEAGPKPIQRSVSASRQVVTQNLKSGLEHRSHERVPDRHRQRGAWNEDNDGAIDPTGTLVVRLSRRMPQEGVLHVY